MGTAKADALVAAGITCASSVAPGEILAEKVLSNTRECLAACAARYTGATIIMKTGTHSPWVSRLLEQQGHRVLVANARKLRAISVNHTKSDAEVECYSPAQHATGGSLVGRVVPNEPWRKPAPAHSENSPYLSSRCASG